MSATTTVPALVIPTPVKSNFTLRMHVNAKPQRTPSTPARMPLQARKGSVSAPDPLGTRKASPPGSALSRLTLVRVPQIQTSTNEIVGRKQLKHGSRPSLESPTRLCFSSASFSPPPRTPSPGGSPGSPTRRPFSPPDSPGRPQPGFSSRQFGPSFPSSQSQNRERLSPSQIYDLAKSSSHPTSKGFAEVPTSFTELPDEVYLPFVDRPLEVRELLLQAKNAKVMMLLAKTIPSTSVSTGRKSIPDLAASPAKWSYEDFTSWLTAVDRCDVKDTEWVSTLRIFVLARSEVLWERIKGMLGIPPELDVDLSYTTSGTPDPACDLTIHPIHPTPFTPGCTPGCMELDEISEEAVCSANGRDQVLGLSLATSMSRPRPSRTNSAPKRSSPLNPNSATNSPENRPKQFLHIKRTPCPMFPSNFANLDLEPRPLFVQS